MTYFVLEVKVGTMNDEDGLDAAIYKKHFNISDHLNYIEVFE